MWWSGSAQASARADFSQPFFQMPPLGLVTHEREGGAVRLGGLKVSMSCANPPAFLLRTTMAMKTLLAE